MWPRRRFITALAATAAGPVAAQFRIEVAGLGGTQVPVTVAAFRDEDKAPAPIAGIIRADLQRSGVFRPSESPLALDERSEVALPE
ncbi:MAG: Tol-Pal system protein TolB, partial [Rubrivivax sp.]